MAQARNLVDEEAPILIASLACRQIRRKKEEIEWEKTERLGEREMREDENIRRKGRQEKVIGRKGRRQVKAQGRESPLE